MAYMVNATNYNDTDATETIRAKRFYYGYRVYIAAVAGHGLIIGSHVTPTIRPDIKELMEVVKSSFPEGAMVFEGKGHASADNRFDLE